ncbi:MAG: hypothetical protein JWO97_3106 [Acidobacteria bacterium]|nr:hypothetical protein [Acidobacteriota bacterium]
MKAPGNRGLFHFMSILDLSDAAPSLSQYRALPERRLSAGRAWLFSLLMPGAGQLYCRATTRGRTILITTIAAIGTAIFYSPLLDLALRIAIVFYVLAPLDAYFTAREHNAGIDVEAANNPRVAAMLNLTTNGFGYVYAGMQSGWMVVVVFGMLFRTIGQTMPLLLEIFRAVIAVHAWRLSTRERESEYPAIERPHIEESSFPEGVPIAVAAVLAGHYWLLVIIGQIAMLTSAK